MHGHGRMKDLCEDLRANIDTIVADWERLVLEEPWFSLPKQFRVDNLPGVILALIDSALCDPGGPDVHRNQVMQAADHGYNRREQGIPESLIFTEYHLLRQALWYYLVREQGSSDRVVHAIMLIDSAITTATNASMWGYYRAEVEALGKWQESLERLIAAALANSAPRFRQR